MSARTFAQGQGKHVRGIRIRQTRANELLGDEHRFGVQVGELLREVRQDRAEEDGVGALRPDLVEEPVRLKLGGACGRNELSAKGEGVEGGTELLAHDQSFVGFANSHASREGERGTAFGDEGEGREGCEDVGVLDG